MAERVALFVDHQNAYRSARTQFFDHQTDSFTCGQFDPMKLARLLLTRGDTERELGKVCVYRGIPGASQDPKGYGAARRQNAAWMANGVQVYARPLTYPYGYPTNHAFGEKPREKGVDVQLAIDFATAAVLDQFDVGILFSLDTDLKPALEAVLNLAPGKKIEVAAWRGEKTNHSPRLSLGGNRPYCHWLDRTDFDAVADATDYTR